MIYGQSRNELRDFYVTAWRKHRAAEPLEPLEQLVAAVIDRHPEYHALLENGDDVVRREFTPEQGQTNPFLHMGMHITLQEQVSADRPVGITSLYVNMLSRTGDAHKLEHRMMECLGETLWEAQRNNTPPDEQLYLERLKRLA